jgi:hypothetical protein
MNYENHIVLPCRNNVLSKVMDGEAILINVSTGTYYSLNHIGCLLWQWIEKEKNIQEMTFSLIRVYDVEVATAVTDIQNLIETLVKEGLVTTTLCDSGQKDLAPDVNPSEKQSYEPPTIDIYRDMQDLLALDPPMPGLRSIPWESTEKPQ